VHPEPTCELIGTDIHERTLYLCALSRLTDWPDYLSEPDPHFVLFLALDARNVSSEALAAFAQKTHRQGLACLCAWGLDCERVHDVFDSTLLADDEIRQDWGEDDSVVVTAWISDESLDEALWEALNASLPHRRYERTCDALLAVVVGNNTWAEHVRRHLTDPEALSRDVLEAEQEAMRPKCGWLRTLLRPSRPSDGGPA
jgi:hypothetical protein